MADTVQSFGRKWRIHPANILERAKKINLGTVQTNQSHLDWQTSRALETSFIEDPEEGTSFEFAVRRALDLEFPHGTISNVILFNPRRAKFTAHRDDTGSDYAVEIDHLLHCADGDVDRIILIECKRQLVHVIDEKNWEVSYSRKAKNALSQVIRQAETVRSYLDPISSGRRLQIDAFIVSNFPETTRSHRKESADFSVTLVSARGFMTELHHEEPEPMRIAQSGLLNLLRMGQPIPELGHPELNNALAFIHRCRRTLDNHLLGSFAPRPQRWAINGSAGMGKSVLLAYSMFVLTTYQQMGLNGNNKLEAKSFSKTASAIGLNGETLPIVRAFALKERQRQVLETVYLKFFEDFAAFLQSDALQFRRSSVELWAGSIPDDTEVLVIDEAHDLNSEDCRIVADWANRPGKFLMIACDRYQKLRIMGSKAKIIEGISFKGKTTKLRLNYRNPFPIFACSLGLMFRWFAVGGVKILPSSTELKQEFGFNVDEYGQDRIILSMYNDAHPANHWKQCVEWFTHPESVLKRLRPLRFGPRDVLWVRFNREDEHFDYEQLRAYTYHNLNCDESTEITNKYIKGQDFPIVVIEGLAEDMEATDPSETARMWQRRQELYICCSRATAFLFLVADPPSSVTQFAEAEFREAAAQLSQPETDARGFQRKWTFKIGTYGVYRESMTSFSDATEAT